MREGVALIPRRIPTNPYPGLLAAAVEKAGARLVESERPSWRWLLRERRRVGVLHLHWLHVFYREDGRPFRSALRALGFAALLLGARCLGYRLVWTLHNARPHDSSTRFADSIAHLAATQLAEVVIHCRAARALVPRRKLAGGVHVIPHGCYTGVYPDTVTRQEARRRLGVGEDTTVFLAFGLIRAYKGLDRLVEAFANTSAREPAGRALLLVVGRPRTEADARQVASLAERAVSSDIRWVLRFVGDEEVQLYMRAADFAVTAFEQVLVSGSAILALSFGLPVIAPRLGCLPELLADGAGLLYDPPAGLEEALGSALRVDRAALAAAARARAGALDWEPIGRAHVAVYRGAAGDPS